MWEEQACLVPACADSVNSSRLTSFGTITQTMAYTEDRLSGETPEPMNPARSPAAPPAPPADALDCTDSGELLDYTHCSLLDQFHEDAIKQAGCGISQLRVVLACGLCVCGVSLELAAIPFVMPSAEMELCILPHEKNWLLLISLVGGAIGSVLWGVLAGRLGRRRTMLSCLAVNAVFASIAAFMPTYGTFMMARFCSALGSAGAAGCACALSREVTSRARGPGLLAALLLAHAAGVLTAPVLAQAVLPLDGASTLIENKEHFSAWHRYLLLCTLPILASLVSLIWTPESPRFLLDAGREVDACIVYQNLHSSNQIRVCGKANVADNTNSAYRLCELTLPGKRPARGKALSGGEVVLMSFYELSSSTYRNITLSLCGTLLFSMAILFYLSNYVPTYILRMENERFEASKKIIQNATFENDLFNRTLENIEYANVTFVNVTFRDMLMSHVAFRNCTFFDCTLSNIRTSYTGFKGTAFVNSTILDTGLELERELDRWCTLNGTVIRGMRGGCARFADLTTSLDPVIAEHLATGYATLAATALALLPASDRANLFLCTSCILLSPFIYLAQSETALYVLEAVYRAVLVLIFFNVCVRVMDAYPASLRCTAHGVIISVSYIGAAVVRGVGEVNPLLSSIVCCVLSVLAGLCSLNVKRWKTDQ